MMKGLANVGDVLAGKYRVEKILGIGGMGMVVAATHLELGQPVALKFMLPSALESPEASARFLREARAAGKLTSEHVCRVSDVGRFESGAPYIVMEYLEGFDLGTMLKRRGPLRAASAIDYVLQACEGLAEAHAQGIIHRDLKPDNLYLSARADGGRIIKVLDFGISKAAVTGIATQTGDILGSPAYMAPEQMRSTKDVDARADVWSLGVVLYQLLTGRLPFSGDSLPKLCLSVMNDDPTPLAQYRQDVPDGLAEVILRCLEKEPEQRYADVGELAAALAAFAAPGGFGSVTRVRSALRGRPAPPDPSQTVPHGFAAQNPEPPLVDTTAPTLSGTIGPTLGGTAAQAMNGMAGPTVNIVAPAASGVRSDLFAPRLRPLPGPTRPSGPPVVGTTTVTGSAGESIEMARSRFPLGLIGALCGAIGLVVVLIVMVLRSGGLEAGADTAELPKAVAAPGKSTEPPPPEAPKAAKPTVEPIVEPIVEPVAEPGKEPGTEPGKEPGTEPGKEPGTEPGKEPGTEPGKEPGTEPEHGPDAKEPKGDRPGPVKGPRGKRPPRQLGKDPKQLGKGPKDPKGAKAPKDPASGGSDATPPDDNKMPTPPPDAGASEEDKWGRMQHDHDAPKGQGA